MDRNATRTCSPVSPGISTDMLARRLKEMEHSQLIARRTLPAPCGLTGVRARTAGRELEPTLMALVRFGLPLLGKRKREHFRIHWLGLNLRRMFRAERARGAQLTVQFEVEGEALHGIVAAQSLKIVEGRSERPDVTVIADEVASLTELADLQRLAEAVKRGRLRMEGKAEDIARAQRAFGLA